VTISDLPGLMAALGPVAGTVAFMWIMARQGQGASKPDPLERMAVEMQAIRERLVRVETMLERMDREAPGGRDQERGQR
jgi:hypothetical protein